MSLFSAVASKRPLRLHPPLAPRHRRRGSYRPAAGLREAVDVAMLLGVPLILTGEPGTGKTRAAFWLADELEIGEPLRFDVKSETRGSDLLYQFDEVARFRDSTMGIKLPLVTYLSFSALGEAILRAAGGLATLKTVGGETLDGASLDHHVELLQRAFGEKWEPKDGRVSVADLMPGDRRFRDASPEHRLVLIDELDKAPRDTPNDLLREVEEMSFRIAELGLVVSAGDRFRPIVIVTSNSEKSLPDPFLRRCSYFDIPFPETDEELRAIIDTALDDLGGGDRLLEDAISIVRLLRRPESGIAKRPGTSELLSWLDVLVKHLNLGPRSSLRQHARDPDSLLLGSLLKSTEDIRLATQAIRGWSKDVEIGGVPR